MHILIVGPGALGGLLAATMCMGNDGSYKLSLLDHNQHRASVINREGLRYDRDGQRKRFAIEVLSDPAELKSADIIFLCVKSYDVEKFLQRSSAMLNPDCLVIFMQNGIAHLELGYSLKQGVTVFGTTTEGATCKGAGHIYHAGIGRTYLGFQQAPTSESRQCLDRAAALLQAGGMEVHFSDSICARIWAKLLINVGINALTVIHDCKNGLLPEIPEARRKMRLAMQEAQAVAEATNIKTDNTWHDALEVCLATADNVSSMLQDVRKKRMTEIEAINGEVVRLAKRYGLPTPMNSELVRQVQEIESRYG